MSERKVLNKYYPPDFDPSKIPRARQGKNRQFTVRLMAPCNMRCNTCGEYIYKGKKFNARKEDVENENYLGIRIYRFYIKCTRCLQEISFKTDPESTDYIIEAGATRNFMALKLAEEQAEREEQAEKEDEATNPMKVLEKRTQASRHEMAVLEALEELKELNQRQIQPSYDNLFEKFETERGQAGKSAEEEDEAFVQSIFGKGSTQVIKRIEDDDSNSSDDGKPPSKKFNSINTTFDSSIFKKHDKDAAAIESSGTSQPAKPSNSLLFQKNALAKLVKVPPKTQAQPKSTEALKQPAEESNSTKKMPVENKQTPASTGLNLLGSYGSDSDNSDSS